METYYTEIQLVYFKMRHYHDCYFVLA